MQWIIGLTFSLVIGHIVTNRFLSLLRRISTLGNKPLNRKGVPPWVTGAIERLFFTILVGLQGSGAPAAMIGWLALKMASNWNHPDWKDKPDARAFALSALLAGLVSMMFALIGGLICTSKSSLCIPTI